MLPAVFASNPSIMRIPSFVSVAVSSLSHTLEVLICGGSLIGSIFAGCDEVLTPHRGNGRSVRGGAGGKALKLEKVVLLIITVRVLSSMLRMRSRLRLWWRRRHHGLLICLSLLLIRDLALRRVEILFIPEASHSLVTYCRVVRFDDVHRRLTLDKCLSG